MFIKIGTYSHPANEVDEIFVSQRIVRNRRNRRQYVTKTLTLGGTLIPDQTTISQATIKSAIQELESAYSRDGKSVGLYHDDGTESPHVLKSGESMSGVRIISLEYPEATGAEYAVQRSFRIIVEADFLDAKFDELVSWQESLSFVGDCGPKDVFKLTLNGPPQKQTVHQRTTQFVTQQGSAIGFRGYPTVPAALFPAAAKREQIRKDYGTPEYNGDALINWPVSWSYVFESAVPLTGRPNIK